jgi:hypothetical protein
MHQQIRMVVPSMSPQDVRGPLQVLADAKISLVAVGGSGVEHGGELALTVSHEQHDQALELLRRFRPRVVEVKVCWLVPGEPGQLLACVEEARGESQWANKRIRDITIGEADPQGRVPVQLFFEGPR